jgi:hypothetical protein
MYHQDGGIRFLQDVGGLSTKCRVVCLSVCLSLSSVRMRVKELCGASGCKHTGTVSVVRVAVNIQALLVWCEWL